MSRTADCFDNALAESFFGSLKRELVDDAHWLTRRAARMAIFDWLEVFYNRRRLHSALGYRSPVAFETATGRLPPNAILSTKPGQAQWMTAMTLGLRQGELLGLQWADVDLQTGTLTVRPPLQTVEGKPRLVPLKTKRSRRRLPLPPTVVEALRAHRKRQAEERLLLGPDWEDWGLPRMRFHDLRHGAATLLAGKRVSMRLIMEVLGHSQMAVTSDFYAHVAAEVRCEVAGEMEESLRAALGGEVGAGGRKVVGGEEPVEQDGFGGQLGGQQASEEVEGEER